MKNLSYLLISAALLLPRAALAQAPSIQVIYPYEGQRIASVPQTFIFGNVAPAQGTLTINGEATRIYPNGSYLSFLPIAEGDFTFSLEFTPDPSQPPVTLKRSVKVGQQPRAPLPSDKLQWDENSVQPAANVEYREGDCFQISAFGSPGMEADFTVQGVAKHVPMTEQLAGSGRYTGLYCFGPNDEAENAEIEVRLSKGWSHAKAQAKGKLTILKQPRVGEILPDTAGLRSDYDGGYFLFTRAGTRLQITGRMGDRLRVDLGPGRTGWIDEPKIKILPPGTPLPKAVTGTIKTQRDGRSTRLQVSLSAPVSYASETDGDSILLTLFNTRNYTNWIVYDPEDEFVREITWKQLDSETAAFKIHLNKEKTLWGYDLFYASGALNMELRQPPTLDCKRSLPLEGLTVVVDPGHSPKNATALDGAVGPAGSYEYNVNFQIARELEPLLAQKGANVVLTRGETGEVPLQNRPLIAWGARGDLYLSIHNNALPDGENPLLPTRGYSVYYYYPSSLNFARHMLSAFSRRISLPNENLRFGDYLVLRQTQMPAILVECAYMIRPDQEILLNTQDFRKKLAETMLEAVTSYAKTLPVTKCQPAPKQKEQAKPSAQPKKQEQTKGKTSPKSKIQKRKAAGKPAAKSQQ